jgi:hypothetical protein
MNTPPSPPQPGVKKHFTSSILLWVRTDQPRQTGMDYWKGPHSEIISATPGLNEYRQIHLAADNPGRWPAVDGLETTIPADRKIDGVAEVTLKSALSPLQGRKQSQLAFKTRSTSSVAPCYTRARPTRPAGTTSQPRVRRSAPAPSSTSAAETGSALVHSGSSPGSSSFPHSSEPAC